MSSTRLPGTPRLLRAINDRAALELLLDQGPLTRAQLGELTGLSKVTASQLVERLEERGLVARVGEQAAGRGPTPPPPRLFPPRPLAGGGGRGPGPAPPRGAAASSSAGSAGAAAWRSSWAAGCPGG